MTTTTASPTALPADWRDFLALTKPRVMTLVVFTALCGMLAAPVPIHPVLGFTAILCITLGAGAASMPHSPVKTTSVITRGLVSARKSRQSAGSAVGDAAAVLMTRAAL